MPQTSNAPEVSIAAPGHLAGRFVLESVGKGTGLTPRAQAAAPPRASLLSAPASACLRARRANDARFPGSTQRLYPKPASCWPAFEFAPRLRSTRPGLAVRFAIVLEPYCFSKDLTVSSA